MTHYCLLPKGHPQPHANGFSQVAWVEGFDDVTYYGASYMRVMQGGSWLPLEHLPSDPEAPPIKITGDCTGARSCPADVHVHGCYADHGACDSPDEHKRTSDHPDRDPRVRDHREEEG